MTVHQAMLLFVVKFSHGTFLILQKDQHFPSCIQILGDFQLLSDHIDYYLWPVLHSSRDSTHPFLFNFCRKATSVFFLETIYHWRKCPNILIIQMRNRDVEQSRKNLPPGLWGLSLPGLIPVFAAHPYFSLSRLFCSLPLHGPDVLTDLKRFKTD